MYCVWVIDFVGGDKVLFRSGVSWKKANRIARKMRRKDRFSAWVVAPLAFRF